MKTRTVAIVTLLIALGGGYYLYDVSARQVADPDIIQAAVTAGDVVETVQVTGTLQPVRTVNVGSQVSGIVSELLADFNSVVRKDQVIARIEPSLFQVQVDLQTAAVERQLGEISRLEMQLQNETANLERARALFDRGLVTRQALDQAELQVKVRTTEVEAARKTLKTAQANLDQAKLNLAHTIIRSPIDGVVINRHVDVGQAVQSSMNVAQFFTLAADLRQLRLEAVVDEADIGRIRPGMTAEFTVDSYGDETFYGTVETVTLNASTQNNVVTYPVWLTVPNDDLKLRPSMTANVQIFVSTARNVTRVPSAATRFRPTAAMFEALGMPVPATRRAERPVARTDGERTPAAAPGTTASQTATAARQIDDLFAPVPRRDVAGSVWVWDPEARTLIEKPVRLGITNGQQTELIEGDLAPGQMVVTNVIVPAARNATATQNVFGSMGGGPSGRRGF